jgi:rhodanese-related sulfurtransferase
MGGFSNCHCASLRFYIEHGTWNGCCRLGTRYCLVNLRATPTMLSMIPRVLAGVDLRDLETIKEIARRAYPDVPQVTTDQLAARLEEGEASLLLLDVRGSAEFAVSHLPGAVPTRSAADIAALIHQRAPAETILYCSVGFRSSRLAHLLARRGVGNVANLEGSIFQWANEGRPLCQGDKPVTHVHPYSARWAGLLRPGLARLPQSEK